MTLGHVTTSRFSPINVTIATIVFNNFYLVTLSSKSIEEEWECI